MANQLFNMIGDQSPNNIIQQFNQFKKSFSGNPQQMIQQMLNSGRITQDQLNSAMQKANQMMKFMK